MKLEFESIPKRMEPDARVVYIAWRQIWRALKTPDHTSSMSCIEPCVLAFPYLAEPLVLLQYCVAILMYGKSESSVWLRLANGEAKEFAHERSLDSGTQFGEVCRRSRSIHHIERIDSFSSDSSH